MNERTIGWAFVAAQAVLISVVVVMPSADHFPVPPWLDTITTVMFWLGTALAVMAAAVLGRALTATPVPNDRAELRTTGPYRLVRHPIYSGVLLIVVALSIGSGNVAKVIVGGATITFFHAKAAWEEQRLGERFSDYAAYAAETPRFLPRLSSIRTRP